MNQNIGFSLLLIMLGISLKAQSTFKQGSGVHLVLGDATLVIDSSDVELNGTLNPGVSTVILSGAKDIDLTSGGNSFVLLELNKQAGTQVILQDKLSIIAGLHFAGTNNKIVLGSQLAELGAIANLVGSNAGNYFITNGTGFLRKVNLGGTPFLFPVGYDTNTYNPVTLTEYNVADTYGVRCLQHANEQGNIGAAFSTRVVDASWEVAEDNPGNMALKMEVQWSASDELPDFKRNFTGVARYGTNGWDLTIDDANAATGSAPYFRERINLSEPGFFAVGNEPLALDASLDLKILLEGPYQGSGLMADPLRANNLLPLNEPYDALGFIQTGFGGNESVLPSLFTITGTNAIVDWVWVEIRDAINPIQIKATIPALLQRDGDIVGQDGNGSLSVFGIPNGNYHIVVKHRNHLGVMTANPVTFSGPNVVYDFSLNAANTFGGSNGIADLGAGRFGLFSGDFNRNGQVQNTDLSGLLPTVGTSGYLSGDLDMNSQVQNTDLQLHLLPNVGKGVQFPDN